MTATQKGIVCGQKNIVPNQAQHFVMCFVHFRYVYLLL